MTTITIPPPRIPVIDQRTGTMSQAWYAFFAQFLQGASNDIVETARDVVALEIEDGNLFVDHAMDVLPVAMIDELRKRIKDLETDFRPDPSAALDAMSKRIAELETELSMVRSPLAAIEELRKRVADIETDIEMGL